jgi:hypothetical protein
MVDQTLPRPGFLGLLRRAVLPGPTSRAALGIAALGLVAAFFAWAAPHRNGWAAGGLGAALALEGAGLIAGAVLARRGIAPRIAGLRSLVLSLGQGGGLGGGMFLVGLVVWPQGFPLLATILAGLVGMAAIARLALARIVLRAGDEGGPGD